MRSVLVPVVGVVTAAAVVVGAVAAYTGRDHDRQRATVVRVVDGDTLVVAYDDAQHRVRLLNVDTPETVAPGQPVQCLGPEATAFLQTRLPVGATVVLRFDEDRLDRYDRELAGVFDGDVLVNAEIARAGLGVAVIYEPNRRFYGQVRDAQEEAERREVGLFSPTLACTLPAEVADLERRGAALVLPDEADLETLDSYTAEVAAAASAAQALRRRIADPGASFVAGTYGREQREGLAARVTAVGTEMREEERAARAARSEEVERIAAAARAAREKAERAARLKAERERAAAEAREERRLAAEAEARAEREAVAEAQRQAEEDAEGAEDDSEDTWTDTGAEGDGDGGSSSGGADTYTGCRAYGSGGTSVDDQGRPYTKIPC